MEKKAVEAHMQKATNVEYVHYPTHPHRSNSSEFNRNHDTLVKDKKLNCFVCDLLHIPRDTHEFLEVHHFLIEWALWESADAKKVQKLFDNGIFDFYGYSKELKGTEVKSPDDIRNLLVLCPEHHRGDGVGVHQVTAPSWFSQAIAKDNVEVLEGGLKDEE